MLERLAREKHCSLAHSSVESDVTAMILKEVHTDNGLRGSVLSGRVSHSSSGDRRVP